MLRAVEFINEERLDFVLRRAEGHERPPRPAPPVPAEFTLLEAGLVLRRRRPRPCRGFPLLLHRHRPASGRGPPRCRGPRPGPHRAQRCGGRVRREEPRAAPLLLLLPPSLPPPGPRRPHGPGARNRAAVVEGTVRGPDTATAGQEVTAPPGRGISPFAPPSASRPLPGTAPRGRGLI